METLVSFLKTNWLDILLVLVGLSAFITYFWQKNDSKRAAATLLTSQIDAIEKSILQLKNDHDLGNQAVYNSGKIMNENLWEKYKHLFVKQLSQSEIDIIQRFFDNAEQIERTRIDLTRSMMIAWQQHGALQHRLAYTAMARKILTDDSDLDDINLDKTEWFALEKKLDKFDFSYTPNMVVESLMKALDNFVNLTGTTAYEKLRKSSFEK